MDDERCAPEDLEEAIRAVAPDCELHGFAAAESAPEYVRQNPVDAGGHSPGIELFVRGRGEARKKAGAEEILEKGFNRLAIVPEKLDCDFYRFLEGDPVAVNSYRYDYMPGYGWAEFSVGALDERLEP